MKPLPLQKMKSEYLITLLFCLSAFAAAAAESDLPLFDTVWQTICRHHYNPAFDTENRAGLHDVYRPQVKAAATPEDARRIINQMLAGTGESHLQLLPPAPTTATPPVPANRTDGDRPALDFRSGNLHLQADYRAERLSDTVGLVAFSLFVPEVIKRFRQDLKTTLAGCRGIIIDIRDNPGGVTDAAVYLASWCAPRSIPLGEMIINGVKLSPRSTPQKNGFRGKIAILIDNDSGSTSEIFAAAMQDAGHARLFGAATPGQCLPSQIIAMPDGSRLQTVFGDIRRPDGRRIEGIGVTPDVPCPPEKAVELAAQWIDETSFFEEIFKWWN